MSFFKQIWKANSKHKKLSEDMVLHQKQMESELEASSTDNDAVTFKLKYLGSAIVEKTMGENLSVESVKSIIKFAKTSRKKIQTVNVSISLKGITVSTIKGQELMKVSIYRISNCSTDPSHRQVLSFLCTDIHETTECHAFLCGKRKTAETVTLAIAHAFTTAYEAWRILPSTKQVVEARASMKKCSTDEEDTSPLQAEKQQRTKEVNVILSPLTSRSNSDIFECVSEMVGCNRSEEQLIDLGDDDDRESASLIKNIDMTSVNNYWVSFDEDFGSQGLKATS